MIDFIIYTQCYIKVQLCNQKDTLLIFNNENSTLLNQLIRTLNKQHDSVDIGFVDLVLNAKHSLANISKLVYCHHIFNWRNSMVEARRQYFKKIFFTPPDESIAWNEKKRMRGEFTAVLDELDQEASLEDLHDIFSIPENTYDRETLKKAVSETTFPGHTLLALYGTLSGLGVEETNLRDLNLAHFWGYNGKYSGSFEMSAPLPRSVGKLTNIEDVQLCIDHYGSSGVTRFPRELCNWTNLKTIDFLVRDFSSRSEVSWGTFVESWVNLQNVTITSHWRDEYGAHSGFVNTVKAIHPNCSASVYRPTD